MNDPPNGLLQYAVPALIFLVVIALRLRRMRSGSRLRLETLWIVPAIYAAVAIALLVESPPRSVGGWGIVALSFAIGAAIGWQRGRSIRIAVDPETHRLNQRASPLTMLLLFGLIAVRIGLREVAAREGAAWHLDAALVTDALVAMALGLFALTRVELFLRGRRLLTQARGY